MTSVVVFSNDPVASAMAGPAIRYFQLARELGTRFEVTLLTPNESPVQPAGVTVISLPDRAASTLNRALEPFDVIVTQMLPLETIRHVARAGKRVIYDLYNPYLVEALAFFDVERPDPATDLFYRTSKLTQRAALETGDAFVCASERQRDLWLGVLAAVGRIDLETYRDDPTLRNLIDVVPYGLPAEPPVPARAPVLKGAIPGIGADDYVLLWAGGIWNWLDPLTPIRAACRIGELRDDVKLLFLGLVHPNPEFAQMEMASRAVELAQSLGVLDRTVFFNPGWVPYHERAAFLLEADVGVSAHFDILETRYAFRTRLLDHFWAGLPTIATRGDVLADLVEERGLGRVVAPEDVDGWVAAIGGLLGDSAERARITAELQHVREELAWPAVVRPLLRLVETSGSSGVAGRRSATALEAHWLRLRTSFALGGPRGVLRRQARKLARRARPRL